ncbi:hypothetical protein RHECNPAF_930073 [Rhizobium etli CNPAF512]|nr:hypothetical protein RHECNPAF_930073 [Rhizobium etli CNPAF512]
MGVFISQSAGIIVYAVGYTKRNRGKRFRGALQLRRLKCDRG